MKTYKIIVVLMVVLSIFSCKENYLEESMAEMKLKSGNAGNVKLTGFDEWGFNWNAQQFNGYGINMILGDPYFDQPPFSHYGNESPYRGEGEEFYDYLTNKYWYFPYVYPKSLLNVKLSAHWNESLISRDGVYAETWLDSDAWVTFRYSLNNGTESWSHFRKLGALKSSYKIGEGENANKWYDENNNEVGMVSKFFEGLMVIQVENVGNVDTEIFYEEYKSPAGSGIGKY